MVFILNQLDAGKAVKRRFKSLASLAQPSARRCDVLRDSQNSLCYNLFFRQ